MLTRNRVEDKSDRYVAAENIEITEAYPTDPLLRIAGRYFHRYDDETKRFVSNIREAYPDD
jgi:F-box protein 21